MEKKKSVQLPPSSSEESSSSEEQGQELKLVRTNRRSMIEDDKTMQPANVESESEEEDEDEGDDEIDGTQRVNHNEASPSETEQPSAGDGASDSDSETSSSGGKHDKSSPQFIFALRKSENANGHSSKKAPAAEKLSKSYDQSEFSPRKGKDKASKKDREAGSEVEKGSSKKHKKEGSEFSGKSIERLHKAKDLEKASKGKGTPSNVVEKKESKKSALAAATAERPESAPSQQDSAKNPGNISAKKAGEKGKTEKKAVKITDAEPAKGSFSPVKPKLFTGKDEIILTAEILHDVQQGTEIPIKKNDGYWSMLVDRVHERMEGSWSKEQLCEKTKRMKVRYISMAEKFREAGEQKFRNTIDKDLFAMWDQLWGNGGTTKVDEKVKIKNKHPKVLAAASPQKRTKASSSRATAPMRDAEAVIEESVEHDGNGDESESEEWDGDDDSHKKNLVVAPMEVDVRDTHADRVLVTENKADNSVRQSISEAQQILHKEILEMIAEIQESSRQTLKEWESKALSVVENAVKTLIDQSRITNGFGMGGLDGFSMPFRSLDMGDMDLAGDQALQQQWHELRLKELEVYGQRLDLMRRECKLKQDQMKLQLHKNK